MSEATPIVHAGFPKTASTWFQKSFYPHVRSPRYVERDRVNAALLDAHALAFDPAEALRTLGLAAGEAAILCEEGLCGYLHNGGVSGAITREVARRIAATLPGARIVLFLRSQPKMLVAAYQQYVRAGGTHGPKRYFFPQRYLTGHRARGYKQPRFDIDFFLYSRIVALYDELFGRERVHLFLFEEFQQGGMDFLKRFAAELQLEVDWDRVSLAPRLASYGMPLTRAARFLNRFTALSVIDKDHFVHIPGLYKARRSLLERLNRTGWFGRSPDLERLVGREEAERLRSHFAADNRLLAERLPLERFGYPLDELRNKVSSASGPESSG